MNSFLTACQATAPIRLEVRRGAEVSEVAFDKAAVLIGRDGRSDLNLLDSDVGSRHLYLQVLRGRLFGVQLADRAETQSWGRPWLGGWILPGHQFEIGRVSIRVLGPDPPEGQPELLRDNPLVPDRSLEPAYALEPLTSRSSPPRRFQYRQELLLAGRSAPCRLVVRHPDVSRCHAAIVRTPSGLWIVDLLSRSGVAVNGVPVAVAEIRPGDRIEFGRVGVRVCLPNGSTTEADRAAGTLVPELPIRPDQVQSLDPILDQVAALQQQTFEQFQELMSTMMQVVGGILHEQRQFVRDELERMERLVKAGQRKSLSAVPELPPVAPEGTILPPPSPAVPVNGLNLPPTDPAATPPPLSETPLPKPTTPPPLLDEFQLHTWLEEQLGTLNRQQSAAWERLVRMFRGR
jgi:pSer/pThr/pTyr-binding forkhead associated (FHA) protein